MRRAAERQHPSTARLPALPQEIAHTMMDKLSEPRMVQAYLRLFLAPKEDQDTKYVSLGRFGAYEVRMCECAADTPHDDFPLRLELYASDRQRAVDSCGCHEFEEAAILAEELLLRARRLHGNTCENIAVMRSEKRNVADLGN